MLCVSGWICKRSKELALQCWSCASRCSCILAPSLHCFTSGLGLYEGNERLFFCSWSIPASACCGLGRGFYSGRQLERGLVCRKLAKRGCWGLHSLAQCLGAGLVSPEPLLGDVPHPAPTPHSTVRTVRACASTRGWGHAARSPPSSHLFCVDQTQGSVHGLSSSYPSPGPPTLPSQHAARYPWGT